MTSFQKKKKKKKIRHPVNNKLKPKKQKSKDSMLEIQFKR